MQNTPKKKNGMEFKMNTAGRGSPKMLRARLRVELEYDLVAVTADLSVRLVHGALNCDMTTSPVYVYDVCGIMLSSNESKEINYNHWRHPWHAHPS